jgi:hypothetical protein
LTYQWIKNGLIISGATGSTYTATSSGSYAVRVENSQGCLAFSPTIQVFENIVPVAVITSSGPNSVCAGGSGVVLVVSNQTVGQVYQWRQGGVAIPGATSSGYTAIQSGNYDCITSTGGCTSVSNGIQVTVNPNPVVSISAGGPTTFCQGGNVTLTASNVAGGTYQWTVGGIDISGAVQANYLATVTGNYAVRVTNTNGCVGVSSNTLVTVNTQPIAQISAIGSTSFCAGGSVILRADTSAGLTYQWQLNGQNLVGQTLSTLSANQQGNYVAVVTRNGCSSVSNTIATTIINLPSANITPSGLTTICQGNPLILQANSGAGLTYQWRLAGNPIPGANLVDYIPIQSGAYTVVVTNSGGCAAVSSAITVTINPLPLATITPQGATTVCAGTNVVLQANAGSGLSYQWYAGNNPISGATSQNLTSSSTGLYKVRVTNSLGCVALSNDIFINVVNLPLASIFPLGPTNICQGSSVLLQTIPVSGVTYQWRNGNLNIAGATGSSYLANGAGTYSLQVTNSNNCSSISNVIAVSVLPIRSTNITDTSCQGLLYYFGGQLLNASGIYRDTLVASNGCDSTVTLNFVHINSPGVPVLSLNQTQDTLYSSTLLGNVRWFRNGVSIPGVTTRFLPISSPGLYTAQSEISLGSRVCSSALSAPFWITNTGIDDFTEQRMNFAVFPNPANHFVTIRSHSSEFQVDKVEAYDLAGKLVLELSALARLEFDQNNDLTFDISGLCEGTYCLQIYHKGNSRPERLKFNVIR